MQTTDIYTLHRVAYVLEWIPAGHLLLELFLELLPRTDGLLVADILRQLLQACLGEILGEVLDALLIGREQLHQSVVHADFPETRSDCIDVFFIYP